MLLTLGTSSKVLRRRAEVVTNKNINLINVTVYNKQDHMLSITRDVDRFGSITS